jgi:hypothetical protein
MTDALHLVVLRQYTRAIVLFQKDNPGGTAGGSRVCSLFPTMSERRRPNLGLAIRDSRPAQTSKLRVLCYFLT